MTATVNISADEVFSRVGFGQAVRAVQAAFDAGLDPAADFERSVLDVDHGQLLLMPSASPRFVGVKVATVAPGNPARGLERIQGVYLLMDAETLGVVATIDGTALTTLRTPALSAAAADHLAPERVDHLAVFGSGPQAWGHLQALATIRTLGRVSIVGRDQQRAAALAERISGLGLRASVGDADSVRDAQLIVCATTARQPLFDGRLVPDDSCTIAVGSHEPDAREFDSVLAARAQLVVEERSSALREAGDVIVPVAEGVIDPASLVPLRRILTGQTPPDRKRPRIFKSVGMSWEDLVIASAVYDSPAPQERLR
ncbi:ornithine cyclodeaminase family protein [Parafrigoribacterium mesophilum]|uniref:ornithine cyclodeaminase family protein n=1 Tax=Parafrigoribacterium mesophilum TaxID=433646 RepID=UPI0031FDC268